MSLDAGSLFNLYSSLNDYINTSLSGTTENFNLHFNGLPFNNVDKSEWIDVCVLDIQNKYAGKAGQNSYAEDCNVLVQFNIYVKKNDITSSDRAIEIRDKIVNYFPIKQDINIYNYDDSTSLYLDHFRVRDVIDNKMSEEEDLFEYILSIELDFTKISS